MNNNNSIKSLKKEIKEVKKKIERLGVEKKIIENKGCFSDSELEEREKKINAINKEVLFLDKEIIHIMQSMGNLQRGKWHKKRS